MSNREKRIPMSRGRYRFGTAGPDFLRAEGGLQPDSCGLPECRGEITVDVDRLLSDQGATCLVYEGTLPESGRRVIIKEFYPYSDKNIWAIARNSGGDQKLIIPSLTRENNREFAGRLRQFLRSYIWQKKFHSEPQFLEIVVEPQYLAVYGDTYYIISDYHNGRSMHETEERFTSLQDRIYLCQYLTDVMSVLEENGYLFLDLCEDNFLVIRQTKSRYQLRLFDMDSIINLNDLDNLHKAGGNIFYHEEYAPREIKALGNGRFNEIKKDYLEKSAAVYSLGVLFFKVLFGHIPTEEERKSLWDPRNTECADTLALTYQIRRKMAGKLADILGGMLSEQDERYRCGFSSCGKVLQYLTEFAEKMNYEAYISQKNIARANATFAAYNMLQKHPLFDYFKSDVEGKRKIKAVIAGSHMMRTGFLSAMISMGQMLDSELEISLVSEDAGEFWEDYISEDQNAGLKNAVLWEQNGQVQSAETDPRLVARPLAYIHICTGEADGALMEKYLKEGYRYFVFLDENLSGEEIRRMMNGQTELPAGEKMCIGYIREEEAMPAGQEGAVHWHPVSVSCFDEIYSEKMYQEQVYQMGLMAHAYYRGFMNQGTDFDMGQLEQEYREDIYSRLSSERAALHGIYKMASVGVDINRPGRFRAYFEKISDPETAEKLAWLEHLSWTAYMLTSGHVPADVSEMDAYAYKWGNDWKDRRDPRRIRHPLLAASLPGRGLPERDWDRLGEEDIAKLDPLDHVSYEIYQWYRSQRPAVRSRLEQALSEGEACITGENRETFSRLRECGLQCIESMGRFWDETGRESVRKWTETLQELERTGGENARGGDGGNEEFRNFLEQMKDIMRPAADSCKNRDYKQIDRDLTYSVLDMTVV